MSGAGLIDIESEFVELIAAFRAASVPYAVIGGFAVAIWGAPRATTDIDVLVREQDLPVALATARTRGFAFSAAPMTFSDGMRLRRVTKVEGEESLTLDLCLVNENLEPAFESRVLVTTGAGDVSVVSRDALIAMKVGAGRPQDLGDVVRLREADR